MEAQNSLFETSEMVANLIASTTLLVDSWTLCNSVNSSVSDILVEHVGPIGLVAFSGVQDIGPGLGPSMMDLVPLKETAGNGLFCGLDYHGEDDKEDPSMVNAGLLKLFLGLYDSPSFQSKIKAVLENSNSIILTGYSTGGAMASLTTLWLLSYLQTIPSPPQVLCITFGSPLLGNEVLSKSLLRQRWAANFCHVVLQHDIVPRLLFAPLASINTQLLLLLSYIQLSKESHLDEVANQMTVDMKNQLFGFVLAYTKAADDATWSAENRRLSSGSYWPFGNYLFCSEDGAVCVDNAISVVKMLHLMLAMGNSDSCFENHRKYGSCVQKLSLQVLIRRGFIMQEGFPMSSYEAGLSLAIESSGLARQESVCEQAKDCLKMAKQMGLMPNLNSAKLSITLSKISSHQAQIEWYKSTCNKSDDQMGYYDTFKLRQASKRESQVNMFRIKLASFWDDVISMFENYKLPHDFHKRRKWVNASHVYQLLVEPLDIADYYKSGEHLRKGHYMKNGREKRHVLFDKWWRERKIVEATGERSKFASLTQDSCFWARMEEARELLMKVKEDRNSSSTTTSQLWKGIDEFDAYAGTLIANKEVSSDVLAKNSSYSLWIEEVKVLRSEMQ